MSDVDTLAKQLEATRSKGAALLGRCLSKVDEPGLDLLQQIRLLGLVAQHRELAEDRGLVVAAGRKAWDTAQALDSSQPTLFAALLLRTANVCGDVDVSAAACWDAMRRASALDLQPVERVPLLEVAVTGFTQHYGSTSVPAEVTRRMSERNTQMQVSGNAPAEAFAGVATKARGLLERHGRAVIQRVNGAAPV